MIKQLDSFCDYLLHEKRYSAHTVTAYKTDITQFANYCDSEYEITELKVVKHTIIRSWIVNRMEKEDTPKSINRKISSLRSFFNFLKRKKLVSKNPMLKIIAPKIPKRLPEFIRKENIEKLLDNLNEAENYATFRNIIIIELLYSTGIRRAELIPLSESDVMKSDGLIKVVGKGNKERLIPLSKHLLDKINKLVNLRNEEFPDNACANLFLTDKGKPVYPKFIYNVVTKLLGTVSTSKKKSPHILRHSFATHLTNNGADINAIKELLGHANLGATQIYTHNSIKKLKEVYSKSHPKAKKED